MNSRSRSDSVSTASASALLEYLRRPSYEPVPQRRLLHAMNIPGERRNEVRQLIRDLLSRGEIVRMPGGKIAAAGRKRRRATPPARHATVLGMFREQERSGVVRPFDASVDGEVHVPASFRMGASDGDVVVVEVLRGGGRGRTSEGKILDVVGSMEAPGVDAEVVARRFGLPLEFPDEVLEAARELPSRVGPKESGGRERFDDPAPVTIDGETAKDFDDAIAVEPLSRGRYRLYVHIADVAHFVSDGDVLDREARARGTSVYFPGRVLPMFPEELSNDLCSLRPGVDRLVQSAILDFDAGGKVTRARFADGVIRSAARLTYTQVASVLDGKRRVRGVPDRLHPMLQAADRLRRILERRRHERGSVDFDLPEPRILLDVEGVMTGVTIEPRNVAHLMIEEFMLAANEAVAGHLERSGVACMFRVHDPPEPDKIELLAAFVKRFGLSFPVGGEVETRDFQRLTEQAERADLGPLIGQVALRSMKQARYAPVNTGHFGLAAPTYCHFTSPIRRYPDLAVHRNLRAARAGAGPPSPGSDEFGRVAEESSRLERNAEAAERELLAWKKVVYIRDRVGERFDGVVTGVARFGLFVQISENLVEGLVRVERLGSERFEFDESRHELTGRRSGTTHRLGDKVRVRVDRVDRVLRRVDFSLV